jgi:hypothetical protein
MKLSTLVQRAMGRLNAIAAGVALLALVAWPALALAQTVSVVPSDTTLVNGETFTVRVATDGSTDLRAYHLIYQYDHSQLQFMSAAVGELAAAQSPSAFLVPDVLSAAPDSVIYDVALLGSSASGPGILAYFTFKALTSGSTTLTPLKVDFRNSLNEQILPATSGAAVHINDVLAVGLGAGGITPVNCFGGSNGAIDITASGGVPPYSYSWNPGGATTEDLAGVAANAYSVTVTDADGRTTSGSWTVTQPSALALSQTHVNVLCNGGSTGSIDLTVTGGTGSHTYAWSNGATTEDLSGLAAGSYSVTVTDANGCTASLGPITISQTAPFTLSETHVNVSCFNGSNGSIDLTVTGGAGSYTYVWSPGGATTQDLTGLVAGSYSVTVTDDNGCSASLGPISISQPALLAASEVHTPTCLTSPDGSITLTVNGGTTPYTYLWSNGAITQNLTGLAAGSYSVTVTDAHGCTTAVGPVAITLRTFTISPTAGVGGSISPNAAQVLNCGANQSFTITPAACYAFTGLLVDGASVSPVSPYTFTDVHANHTIAASFTAIALPLAVTSITAVRSSSGNDASGVTKITINYTAPGDGSTVEIWRKGFGNYPEYDDNPGAGSIPSTPASYPPAGWTQTAITASGQTDTPPARDYWYYVACTKNACGQTTVSTVETGGTLDYFLGDVHNGMADCTGDNHVTTSDISFLGEHYGIHISDPDAFGCLDVGPTSTGWVDGRPLTDNQVEFEDLIMFAINYGTVSQPSMRASGTSGTNLLSLLVPATPAVGETFEAVLEFKGGGGVQGLSAQLEFDASVVEPLAVVGGSLLAQQAGPAQVFSAKPGTVDAAVFGNGLTLSGAGELARVRFRVKSAGDAGIVLGGVRARDTRNQPVALATPLPVEAQAPPTRMEFAPSYPNPFTTSLTVVFGMPMEGPAKLAVFDIQGRTVRHLLDGTVKAGWTRTVWNGRSDEGVMLAPGMYVIRLSAAGRVTTKSVRLVR